MDSVKFGKHKLASTNEFDEVLEKLLSCLPPYANINFFLDIVQKHHCFDDNHNNEFNLIILGTGIPEEFIYASEAKPYWILGGSRFLSSFADDLVPRDTDPVSRAMLGCLRSDMNDFPMGALILIPLINDSSRKLAYILKTRGYQVHTVYIPPIQGEVSDQELLRQGETLAETIYRYTGKRITTRGLLEAQEKIAEARKQIRYFMQITYEKPELLPSIWRLFILHSYYCTDNLEDWSKHLRMLNSKLDVINAQKSGGNTSSVLLLGSPVYFPNYKIPFLIHDVKLNIAAHLDYTTETFLRPYRVDKKLTIETLMQSFYKRDCYVSFRCTTKYKTENRVPTYIQNAA